jgi:hypothetical protein
LIDTIVVDSAADENWVRSIEEKGVTVMKA